MRVQQVVKRISVNVDNRGAGTHTVPPFRNKTCSECGAKNKMFTTFFATLKA
ncbi:Uncharacterised protein [Akkermansia muciniphila]|uniref:Uncharacterized protein n=1 Tax=Akkermansia muciniphila TaxID=239935 RepID=A0A6N2RLW7_9BACT